MVGLGEQMGHQGLGRNQKGEGEETSNYSDPFVDNGESDGEQHEGGETESETADVEVQSAANKPPEEDEDDGH